jgi:hypothetical protein
MTPLIILGVIVAVVLFVLWRKGDETDVKMADIPTIFEVLKTTGKDASWAQFCFGIQDNSVNLQFSIENGRIGFDWFLLCPANVRDKEKFRQLAERLGHNLTEHKYENGSENLRTEDGDLVALCEACFRDLYQWPVNAKIGMVWDGFSWPLAEEKSSK